MIIQSHFALLDVDRRTISIVGAILCYLSRTGIDNLHAVNFDVMILLSSIMTVNYLVIHLKETRELITRMQHLVHDNPVRGLWALSFASYITSPFLTNDGVCLLFVEPILQTFEHAPLELPPGDLSNPEKLALRKADAIFFLLALACSANIGSSLTYTGNPQNMIVSSDAISVMPSYMFFIFMLPASIFSWVISKFLLADAPLPCADSVPQHVFLLLAAIKWIERCWMQARTEQATPSSEPSSQMHSPMHGADEGVEMTSIDSRENDATSSRSGAFSRKTQASPQHPNERAQQSWLQKLNDLILSFVQRKKRSHELVISPRRQLALEKAKAAKTEDYLVVSPFPYAVPLLLCAMIAMIFAGVLPISGTVCVFSVLMIVTVVVGNHYRGQQTFVPVPPGSNRSEAEVKLRFPTQPGSVNESPFEEPELGEPGQRSGQPRGYLASLQEPAEDELGPLTWEDEVDNINRFFAAVYGSIDYNVLMIFLGLFIVIDNLSYTGIPRTIWNAIVGKAPFKSFGSVLGICVFVVVMSQFLGNVPVIQLAKPNVEGLDDNTKRLAWALLAFVSTVAGNLTLTGSAGECECGSHCLGLLSYTHTPSSHYSQHHRGGDRGQA
jgi:Na+/H+ antiporter NhaD/arsenite permease-like protein